MRLRRETGDFSVVIQHGHVVKAPVRTGFTAEDLIGLVVTNLSEDGSLERLWVVDEVTYDSDEGYFKLAGNNLRYHPDNGTFENVLE